MYQRDPESSQLGGKSIGVPGDVMGFEEVHRRWGKLPWHRLLTPSIALARGWELDREMGRRIPVSLI